MFGDGPAAPELGVRQRIFRHTIMNTYTIMKKDGPTPKVHGDTLELSDQGNIGIIRNEKGDIVVLINMDGVIAVHATPS